MVGNIREQVAQFIPFIIFYLYLVWNCIFLSHFPVYNMDSLTYFCAVLAMVKIFYCYYRKWDLDYIALGTDLYIIGSAVLCFLPSYFLFIFALCPTSLSFYLRLSSFPAVFLAITGVGLITTFASHNGFIQGERKGRSANLKGSLLLLFATLGAFIGSTVLRWSLHYGLFACRMLSLGIPLLLIVLILVRALLRGYFTPNSSVESTKL